MRVFLRVQIFLAVELFFYTGSVCKNDEVYIGSLFIRLHLVIHACDVRICHLLGVHTGNILTSENGLGLGVLI